MLLMAGEMSATANNIFKEKVPAKLVNYLKENKKNLVPEFG